MEEVEKGREIARLIGLVKELFADVPYPGDHVIQHPDFIGERWETISDNKIEKNFDELPIHSEEGFRYFLPAYLLYSLKHFNARSQVFQFTVYVLGPGKEEANMAAWHRQRFGLFTDEQMQLIYSFLELVLEDEDLHEYHKIVKRGLPRLKKYRSK
jgi:hypothetical protein